MEQTTQSAATDNSAANTIIDQPTKKALIDGKSQNSKMTVVYEIVNGQPVKQDETSTLFSYDFSDFRKSVGAMLNDIHGSAEFTYLGHKFTVKPVSVANSNLERSIDLFKQLVKFAFPPSLDQTKEIKGSNTTAIVSLKSFGLKFTKVCKIEVATALNEWIKNRREKVNAIKLSAYEQNAEMMEETKVLRKLNGAKKAELLSEATGLNSKIVVRLKASKQFSNGAFKLLEAGK